MEITEDQLDRAVYEELKSSFSGVTGWIHQDYFQREVEGFKHFKSQFDEMKSESSLSFEDQDAFDDAVTDYAEEIASELRRNNFISTLQQCFN